MPKQKNRSIYTLLYWVISEVKRGRETEIERERQLYLGYIITTRRGALCHFISVSLLI